MYTDKAAADHRRLLKLVDACQPACDSSSGLSIEKIGCVCVGVGVRVCVCVCVCMYVYM